MKRYCVIAWCLVLSLAVSAQRVTLDGFALRFSSIHLPKEATIANLELRIVDADAVVVRNLPDGWCTTSATPEHGVTNTQLACYPYHFERRVVPRPVPLADLDYSVLVRVRREEDDEVGFIRRPTVTGRVDYLLPGDQKSRSYEFTDEEVQKVYGDE